MGEPVRDEGEGEGEVPRLTQAALQPPREAKPAVVALPAAQEPPPALPVRQRKVLKAGERYIARLLRGGAVVSGGLFVCSLVLRALPPSQSAHVAVDYLEEGAVSLLLATPVARLLAAGTLLGARGEWRYAAYAGGVLGLLALAVGAGWAV